MLARAGWHAFYAADLEAAERLLTRALAEFESTVDIRGRGAAMRKLGQVLWRRGRHDEAIAITEAALAAVPPGVADEERAAIASSLGLALVFTGDHERAEELLTLALDLSESLGAVDVTSRVLQGKGIIASAKGHPEEALALTKHGLTIALDHEDWERVYNLYFNLSDSCSRATVTRRRSTTSRPIWSSRGGAGHDREEWSVLAEMSHPLAMLGRWEEALANAAQIPEENLADALTMSLLTSVLEIHLNRGDLAEARRLLGSFEHLAEATDLQDRAGWDTARAAMLRAEGKLAEALETGARGAEVAMTSFGPRGQSVKQGFVEAIEAALALGERGRAEELLGKIETIPPGLRAPYVAAQADRFRARLAGESEPASAAFEAAAARFREIGAPFWLGITCLEHGEWLLASGRPDDGAVRLAEARLLLEPLAVTPWLDRLDRAAATLARTTVTA